MTFTAIISDKPKEAFKRVSRENAHRVSHTNRLVEYKDGSIVRVFDPRSPETLCGLRFDKVLIDEEVTQVDDDYRSLLFAHSSPK